MQPRSVFVCIGFLTLPDGRKVRRLATQLIASREEALEAFTRDALADNPGATVHGTPEAFPIPEVFVRAAAAELGLHPGTHVNRHERRKAEKLARHAKVRA